MLLGEEALSIQLDDDRLAARSEEALWESVVGWIRSAAGPGVGGWRSVVGKARFPLMEEDYLIELWGWWAGRMRSGWRVW